MQCCNNQQQQQQPGGTGSFTPQATTFVATYAAYLHTYIQIQIQIQIQIRRKKIPLHLIQTSQANSDALELHFSQWALCSQFLSMFQ